MLFSALISAGWFACRQADSFVFPRPDLGRFRSSMVEVLSYCSPASQLGGLNQQPAAIITPAMELVREYHGSAFDLEGDSRLIACEWARIPHFFYNFYVYKYATGLASAVTIA
ncbi:MAG: hypothetical protein QHH02_09485, partial [Syntrophomonadaceae bacterium]|nr:hypothetical protein [Syntrophomonadaceae bacterium]